MTAIVYDRYGSPAVLRCVDVEKPVPGDDQVLLKVRAASVNPLDWHFMRGTPMVGRIAMGLRAPKLTRLGADVAGDVEAVGAAVTRFRPGDAVFGMCRGSFAEYACAKESALAAKPANVTFEQAAGAPIAAVTALAGLRDAGHTQPGQNVLVNGAAGGVGTFAVQIAKAFGAHVAGVCSTRNVDMVRSIGADRIVDYTRDDFTRAEERYDVMLDCIGNHPLTACARILTRRGIYVMIGGPAGRLIAPLPRVVAMKMLSLFVSQRMVFPLARINSATLTTISELMEAGKVTPVIDRRYTLDRTAEAIRYLEQGHARGKVVIAVQPG